MGWLVGVSFLGCSKGVILLLVLFEANPLYRIILIRFFFFFPVLLIVLIESQQQRFVCCMSSFHEFYASGVLICVVGTFLNEVYMK